MFKFMFRRKPIDQASALSEKLYAQRKMLNTLRVAELNLINDESVDELELVKRQITQLTLQHEIDQAKLTIVLKGRELKALS